MLNMQRFVADWWRKLSEAVQQLEASHIFTFSMISAYSCYLMLFSPSFGLPYAVLGGLASAEGHGFSSGCSRWKWGMAEVPFHFPYSYSSWRRWLQCVYERLWEEQSVASCFEAFCRHAWDEACGLSTSTFSAVGGCEWFDIRYFVFNPCKISGDTPFAAEASLRLVWQPSFHQCPDASHLTEYMIGGKSSCRWERIWTLNSLEQQTSPVHTK